MRRLYVAPHDVCIENLNLFNPRLGFLAMHLITYRQIGNNRLLDLDHESWLQLPEVIEWQAKESLMIINTCVGHHEGSEDLWHSHPDVAILPHPTFEGNVPISNHLGHPLKKIQQKHLDALATIGVKEHHTVWDVSDKVRLINKGCALRVVI